MSFKDLFNIEWSAMESKIAALIAEKEKLAAGKKELREKLVETEKKRDELAEHITDLEIENRAFREMSLSIYVQEICAENKQLHFENEALKSENRRLSEAADPRRR